MFPSFQGFQAEPEPLKLLNFETLKHEFPSGRPACHARKPMIKGEENWHAIKDQYVVCAAARA
jgi:hypothetical protein